MGFLSPSGMRSGFKVMRQIHRQSAYMSFAGDSPLAEIDDDESFGDYLERLGVPENLQVTLRGPLDMILGDPMPAGQALMRAYIGETMLHSGKVYMPERGIGSLSEALATACSDAIRVSAPVRRVVVADGTATGVVVDGVTIEADVIICGRPWHEGPRPHPRPAGRDTPRTQHRQLLNRLPGGDRPGPLPTPSRLARGPLSGGRRHPAPAGPLCLPPCVRTPGKSILDLLIGRDRAKELIPLDDDEIKRQLLGAARRKAPPGSALPDDNEGLFFRVYRWEEALCMGTPGMLAAVADIPEQLAGRIDNLFLAGDYTRVPSVNGALASGYSAGMRAADMLGSRFR